MAITLAIVVAVALPYIRTTRREELKPLDQTVKGPVKKSDFKEWRNLAEKGDAAAQCRIAAMYYIGEGVAQDYTEALKWFRKAAEQGNSTAQYLLGMMYRSGQGIAQDYDEASKWLRKAAEQGDAAVKEAAEKAYGEVVTENELGRSRHAAAVRSGEAEGKARETSVQGSHKAAEGGEPGRLRKLAEQGDADANKTHEEISARIRKSSDAIIATVRGIGYRASKDGKTYHRPECSWGNLIAAQSLVIYGTREEAEAAGKRPCRACNP